MTKAKIRYKEISSDMESLMAPSKDQSSRSSIGMQEKIGEYYYISLEKLKPYRNQARHHFDVEELEELARTIREHGVRQPLSVMSSPDQDGTYEIVSGERRFRAAQLVGLETVPCLMIKDPERAEEVALIENLQRADLHPVEQADAYHHILSRASYGGTSALAKKLGKAVSTISETVKLASLPEEIKAHLVQKNIRSKVIFRKLILLGNLEAMRMYLGLEGSKAPPPKSILRVSLVSEKIVLERNAMRQLSVDQKALLKEALLEVIQAL